MESENSKPLLRTDSELIACTTTGDLASIGLLFERHREKIKRMITLRMDRRLSTRIDASDVVQETWLDCERRFAYFISNQTMPFFAWLRMLAAKLRGRGESASDAERRERLDRLRSSKSNVGVDLDRQKANLQFEEQIDNVAATTTNAADSFGVQDKSKLDPSDFQAKAPTMQSEEEQSYTSRLLDAKRKAKKNQ